MNGACVLKPSLPKMTILLIRQSEFIVEWLLISRLVRLSERACSTLRHEFPIGKVWSGFVLMSSAAVTAFWIGNKQKQSKRLSLVFAVSWDSDTGILIINKGSKLYLYISLQV